MSYENVKCICRMMYLLCKFFVLICDRRDKDYIVVWFVLCVYILMLIFGICCKGIILIDIFEVDYFVF